MTLVLIIMAAGCDLSKDYGDIPAAKGKLTINGIPAEYEGKSIFLSYRVDDDVRLCGFADMHELGKGDDEKIKLAVISNGTANLPLYIIDTNASSPSSYIKAYDGNDTFSVTIFILDVDGGDTFFTWNEIATKIKQPIDRKNINKQFSGGNLTVDWGEDANEGIPAPKRIMTINGIPPEYNRKFILFTCTVNGAYLCGITDIYVYNQDREHFHWFPKISDRTAQVPLYIINNEASSLSDYIKAYNGNDTLSGYIYIVDEPGFSTWEDIIDAQVHYNDRMSLKTIKETFVNGNLTVKWFGEQGDQSEIIPNPKRIMTINGIPSGYNGKFILFTCTVNGAYLYGVKYITHKDSKRLHQLPSISNGTAQVPLYIINNEASSFSDYIKAYDGNDTFNGYIYIVSEEEFSTRDEIATLIKQPATITSKIYNEKFSAGNLTVVWSE